MAEVLAVVVPLYVLILLGLLASRAKAFGKADVGLNSFVYWFALPAFLFDAIVKAPSGAGLPVSLFLVAFVVTLGFSALVYLASRLAGLRPIAGRLSLAAGYGNVGYFAFPLILSVLGPRAALPMALTSMVHNLIFMVGYPALATAGKPQPGRLRRALLKAGPLNPAVISVVAALIVRGLGLELPEMVAVPVTLLAQAVIPVALFAIGLSLGPAVKQVWTRGSSLVAIVSVAMAKLLVLPLLTWAAAKLFVPDPTGLLTAVLVLLAAMPTGATTFTLSQEFDGDGHLVAAVVAVSTLLALVTVSAFSVLVV
ncbi:AEC family transporter [Tessaracoccus sp. MC1865]|uniref:AEC family transporter n=1 Tax=Tessaracoccus sp. MC1865 TaxID=2760310 RepID=UPI0015FEF07E|nr:AEC family transporter [Tessaracoccus sp. MC1865]MBB1483088.1 AEC family transporter [Tessaracoccus sp. MC1865]QTO37482.1 AEC family transporter [Tessaracoccus sp. MC1865]